MYNTIIENKEPVGDINDYPDQAGKYTFYDLDQGATVADSSSDLWDIAFGGTTLLANAEHGGGIQVIQSTYSEVKNAPEMGFSDTNASWYVYTGEATRPLLLKLQRVTMLKWKYLVITKGTQM